MVMQPEQRLAQRTLVGLFRAGSGVRLNRQDGLCIFRSRESEEWGLSSADLTAHLDVLGIPYRVVVTTLKFTSGVKAGFDVRVPWDELGAVTRWVPSLQKSIDGVAAKS